MQTKDYILKINMRVLTKLINVTGFWKTDQNITLGLFHFIAQPRNSYIYTLYLPMNCGTPGLADWSALVEHFC